MAKKKLRVGILFGGKSGEHEISLRSARSILKAIDRKKYEVVELGITKEGRWLRSGAAHGLLETQIPFGNDKEISEGGGRGLRSGAEGLETQIPFGNDKEISEGGGRGLRSGTGGLETQIPFGNDKQISEGGGGGLRSGAGGLETQIPFGNDKEISEGGGGGLRSGTGGLETQIPFGNDKEKSEGDGGGLSIVAAAAEPAAGTGLDVVFPVLHGTFGEDGTIQGLFELADLAYVGSGVLGSAAGMDKDAMKRMFVAAGLPLTPHVTLLRSEWKADAKRCVRLVEKALEYPVFVKPANLGSSVGISKVKSRKDLAAAMDLAAGFDRKIVIEQGVGGPGVKPRELEVAVLGNDAPEASVVGEIVPAKEFYDYEAKYELNGADESESIIPAKLSKAEEKKIRAMAIAAFKACDCAGLARVDFLMAPAIPGKGGKGKPAEIVLNEVNTMPGFTSISMYPKLWAASGLAYPKLIDRLIELAMERHREKLETSFSR